MAAAKAYQKNASQFAIPSGGVPASGCQQASSCSVIGSDANITANLVNQAIGLPAVPAGLIPWDGDVP